MGLRIVEGALAHKQDHPVRHFVADDEGLLHIPVEAFRPNPDQPRKHFDEAAHEELTASVKEMGILEPVIAYKDPDAEGYILIAGERRLRAAKAAGLATIPATVRSREDALEIAIVENLQRENLSAIDEAAALAHLKEVRGYTDEQLAKVVGKSRSSVTEALSINKLPEAIKAECRALDIGSKIQLLSVLRAGSPEKMQEAWEAFRSGKATTTRQIKAQTKAAAEKRPEPYRFLHKPKGRPFQVLVKFSKSRATREEVKAALKDALKQLSS